MQPDDIDWKILDIVRRQHTSNNAIARELDVSEATVRVRMKRLKEAGLVEVRALIDPEALEHQQLAYIGIGIKESRQLREMGERIAQLDQVLAVSLVSGRYDLLVEILVDSNKGLVQFVTESLSTVEGIARTESFVVLRSYGKWV